MIGEQRLNLRVTGLRLLQAVTAGKQPVYRKLSKAIANLHDSRSITLQVRALEELRDIYNQRLIGSSVALEEILLAIDHPMHMVRDRATVIARGFNRALVLEQASKMFLSAFEHPRLVRELAVYAGIPANNIIIDQAEYRFNGLGERSYSEISVRASEETSDTDYQKIVYVFLPTAGSADGRYPSINDALESLLDNLRGLPREYRFRLMVCANNVSDATEARILRFMFAHPEAEIVFYSLPPAAGHFGKVRILNFLYSKARADLERRAGGKEAFIYCSDDDVFLHRVGGKSAILDNIEYLDREGLRITSGNVVNRRIEFSAVHPLKSFWRYLGGVRRLPEYSCRLAQVYGSSMTMRFESYPAGGIPEEIENEDCWIFYRNGTLHAATNPRVMVEHAPPDSLRSFALKWLRDLNHGANLRRQFAGEEGAYLQYRAERIESFREISRRIRKLNRLHPRRMANWAGWKVKEGLKFLWEHDLVPAQFRRQRGDYFYHHVAGRALAIQYVRRLMPVVLEGLGWQRRDQHETYLRLQRYGRAMVDYLVAKGWTTTEEKANLFSDYARLKHVEKIFRDRGLLITGNALTVEEREIIEGNAQIRELYSIIYDAYAKRAQLKTPRFIKKVFAQAGLRLGENIEVRAAQNRGRVNPTYIVIDHESGRRYFVKYIDFLGRDFNQIFPEVTARFVQVLNENVNAAAMGEGRVVRSIYPNLEQAREAYLKGPSYFSEVADAASRIIIQEDLSGRAETLEDLMIRGEEALDPLVRAYADSLAGLHGSTFGWRHIAVSGGEILGPLREMIAQPEIVRNLDLANYRQWLTGAFWRLNNARRYLAGKYIGTAYSRLAGAVEARGLDFADHYHRLIEDSVAFVEHCGVKGHFDPSSKNAFRFASGETQLFDSEQVGFTDPAVEIAAALKSVLKNLLKSRKYSIGNEANRLEIVRLLKLFTNEYFSSLIRRLPPEVTDDVVSRIKQRSQAFFELFIVDRMHYMVELAGLGLREPQLNQAEKEEFLLQICLALPA